MKSREMESMWSGPKLKDKTHYLTAEGYPLGTTCWYVKVAMSGRVKFCCADTPIGAVRAALDSLVDPFLNPIRRVLPSTGMADFSPIVLWLLIEVVERILIQILLPLA